MSFFDKILSVFSSSPAEKRPAGVRIGRFSDVYKAPSQYDDWDACVKAFDEKDYLNSYEAFFKYLNDVKENSVRYQRGEHNITFEIVQGSNTVLGVADNANITAEAKVVKTNDINIGLMRRLMETNNMLYYSRFAIDDVNNIVIRFDSPTMGSSPYKVYHALKEVATYADKQDDLLLGEFDTLESIGTTYREEIPEAEKKIKYDYLQAEIKRAFELADDPKNNAEQWAVPIYILYISTLYRLDFLLHPEGYILSVIERISRMYQANNDGLSLHQKNKEARKDMEVILARTKEQIDEELYLTKTTFGITLSNGHEFVTQGIDAEMPNLQWYIDNKHPDFAVAYTDFVIGHTTFNYALPKPDQEMFDLYYRVRAADYCASLGFEPLYYDSKNNEFNKSAIKSAINNIIRQHSVTYPKLKSSSDMLKFDNMSEFGKSFLLMLKQSDFTTKE